MESFISKNRLVLDLFEAMDKAIMTIVHWIITLSPIGIFGLIAGKIGEAGGGDEVVKIAMQLGKYVFCVLLGLLIHGFVVLPLLLRILSGRNSVTYFKNLSETLLTAFSTASSSATLNVWGDSIGAAVIEKLEPDENTC